MQSSDQKNSSLHHEKKSIYEDEKSYCEYMNYKFEEEPYETDLKLVPVLFNFL